MKIKDYKCKCGHNDFFFANEGNQKGIYCSYCGKWLKWADKDERNLREKQEPCEDCISRQSVLDLVVANHREINELNVVMYSPLYKDIKELPSVNSLTDVLDKIRAEIEAIAINGQVDAYTMFTRAGEQIKKMALDIIDKYRKEQNNADSN